MLLVTVGQMAGVEDPKKTFEEILKWADKAAEGFVNIYNGREMAKEFAEMVVKPRLKQIHMEYIESVHCVMEIYSRLEGGDPDAEVTSGISTSPLH